MYSKNEMISLTISDAGEDQQWFGRLPDGMAVFVQGAAAIGDMVSARILKVKPTFLQAKLVEVIKPSCHRIDPACSHFGICGGCKWQHMRYDEQVRLKQLRVESVLAHLGGVKHIPIAPLIPADQQFHYRNKIEFSFSDKRFLSPDELTLQIPTMSDSNDFALGFHAPHVYSKVVDIERCYLATTEMNLILKQVKSHCLKLRLTPYSAKTNSGLMRHLMIRQSHNTNELMINLVTSEYQEGLMTDWLELFLQLLGGKMTTFVNNVTTRKSEVAFGEKEYIIHGPGHILEMIDGKRFRISANSFFQTNTRQAEKLLGLVAQMCQLTPSNTLYDLYCGTGMFGIALADRCRQVIGIETIPTAIADARLNAQINHANNCNFVHADLNHPDILEMELAKYNQPQVIIVDPPRAGLHPKTLSWLQAVAPPRIVYVSCNPASLARDLSRLCEADDYHVSSLYPVDMFPHTSHIEVAVALEKTTYRSSGG